LSSVKPSDLDFSIVDKFFKSYNVGRKLLLPVWVRSLVELFTHMGHMKTLTYFSCVVEYRPICIETEQVFSWKLSPSASPSLQRWLSGSGLFWLSRRRITFLFSSLYLSVCCQSALRHRRALFLLNSPESKSSLAPPARAGVRSIPLGPDFEDLNDWSR
jgi:hypothetical protein